MADAAALTEAGMAAGMAEFIHSLWTNSAAREPPPSRSGAPLARSRSPPARSRSRQEDELPPYVPRLAQPLRVGRVDQRQGPLDRHPQLAVRRQPGVLGQLLRGPG